jgi:apolipoprotein N-acyltransferase
VDEIGELADGHLVSAVPLRDDLTLADRVGAAPELLLAASGVLLWVLAVVGLRRRRHVGSGAHPSSEEIP